MEVDMPYTILGDLQTLKLNSNISMDNPCCILTLNCEVLIMDNITVKEITSGSTLFTLPESMTPLKSIHIPVVVGSSETKPSEKTISVIKGEASKGMTASFHDNFSTETVTLTGVVVPPIMVLQINPDGAVTILSDLSNTTIYTNGLTFNVADRYYNSDIGNNISQGTSPLR